MWKKPVFNKFCQKVLPLFDVSSIDELKERLENVCLIEITDTVLPLYIWPQQFNERTKSMTLTQYKKAIRSLSRDEKEQFSLTECKGVLNDYLSRTVDEGTRALMHLDFSAEAAELSAVYGDYGEKFYNSLESSAEKFLDYAKLHPDFFRLHEEEFENLISTASSLGYGVSDNLGYMMEDVRIELGYYDD